MKVKAKGESKGLNRRDFVITASAFAGGLMVACKTRSGGNTKDLGSNLQSIVAIKFPNAWVAVSGDGDVVYTLDRVEMGQGTMTTLASIVAEELGVQPSSVTVQLAPPDKVYVNNEFGVQITGSSNSMSTSWQPLRLAAAATRDMLIAGGAQKLGVKAKDCAAANGRITHKPTGRDIGIGEIALFTAQTIKPPTAPIPKSQAQYQVLGTPVKRLDSPRKVLGRADYGMDVKLDGLLIAVVQRIPEHGARLDSFDDAKAKAYLDSVKVKGDIVQLASGVAVATRSYYFSKKAADLIELKTSGGIDRAFDGSMKTLAEAQGLLAGAATRVAQTGAAESVFQSAAGKLEAFYELPYLPHATLEPQNCTARFDGVVMEIWAPTQAPDGARGTAARATGLSEGKIKVNQTLIGGGFGRRLSQDYVADVAELAFKLKKPVKVVFSREDDTRHDYYRPGVYNVLRGSIQDGRIGSWYHRIIGQSIAVGLAENALVAATPSAIVGNSTLKFLGRVVENFTDKHLFVDTFAVEGADKIPYAIPNLHVEYKFVETGVPIGFWRSVGHSHNAFCVESFVDELAQLAGKDPVQFRAGMLGGKDRVLNCLKKVAEISRWSEAPPTTAGVVRAKGVASHGCFNSFCAQVVQVAVKDGKMRVEKVWVAVDCGLVLNPDIVRQQVEGAVIYGLSAALKQKITFKNGQTVQANFGDGNELIRMNEAPEIEVALVNDRTSGQTPTGIGEVAVPALAPALANALARATGKRFRALPLPFELLDRVDLPAVPAGQAVTPATPQPGTTPASPTTPTSPTTPATPTTPGASQPAGDHSQLIKTAYEALDKNCVAGCHDGDNKNFHKAWTSMDKTKAFVKAGNPDGSRLIQRIRAKEMPIDKAGAFVPVPDADVNAIIDWIKAGAPKT